MDSTIKELENIPFSGQDILDICNHKTKIVISTELGRFKTIDSLLKPYNCVVLLYQTKSNYGHWVCLIKHKKYIEFFDSYGMAPDDQLKYISENFQIPKYLTKLLSKSKLPIVYNSKPLQIYKNDISTCGRHIAFRICMKHLDLNKYLKLLQSSKLSPDEIVTYLTSFQN